MQRPCSKGGNVKVKESSIKMESEALERGCSRTHAPLAVAAQPAGGRTVRMVSTREDILHIGILSPACKKRKEEPTPSNNSLTRACRQQRNHCAETTTTSNSCSSPILLFTATLSSFLLKLRKADLPFVFFQLARAHHSLPVPNLLCLKLTNLWF